uniref:Telomerase reverse transcriptase n=1 Tax=Paramecium caudatum TaxID=5885 RepID=Q9GRC5_PARCA|nr:telomerase reverse transcriptase [Paramecium caudatum]
MLITLQQIAQLYNVITLQDYLKYLDVDPPKNIFFQNTIICSETQNLQKFPIKKPLNFLYQKLSDDQRRDEIVTDSRNDFQFQKQKSFIGCQKLMLSDNMEHLYREIGEQNFDYLLKNYKILIKDDNDSETYIQISGDPIMKIQPKQKQQIAEKIQRQQILYCNHMSRQVGMFKKNFISYAKKQIIKSNYIKMQQITPEIIAIKSTSNILDYFYNNKQLSPIEISHLRPILESCMKKLQKFNFHGQFKFFVPLPSNYKQLKQETKRHLKDSLNVSQLLDHLYLNHIPHQQITSLVRNFLREIIPIDLFGQQNLFTFLTDISDFITLLRFEDQSYLDYIKKMNVFEVPWLNKYFNKKKQRLLIIKKRNQMIPLMKFMFQEIIIPFLRHNFYITERMKDDWKLFYYRKEIWHLILQLSLTSLTKNNFEEISVNSIKTPYVGKLRIVPKPGTFRPIVTYNRKAKTSKISLNRKLVDIKYILRNLRIQPLGYSVFGNPEVFSRLEEFKKLWIKLQQPKTYYITMDIQKCYDTIILQKLLQFIEESKQFSSIYAINKYHIVSRNNRMLKPSFSMKDLFNILDRTCAIPFNKPQLLQKGYIEHIQKNKQTIIINQGFQNSVTFSEFLNSIKNICQNNIVQFENRYFRQTLGIPQGLNISGILCSFYLANLEQKLTNKILGDTLIMRLTDDYCCLAFSQDSSIKILNNFTQIEKQYQIRLNHDKTQHNIERSDRYFKWIGKIIDIETLTLKPAFYLESDTKFQYQINVNLPTKVKTYYIKSKLKSLILNQFKFFFNSKLNDKPTMIKVLKIFVHSGLVKLISFLKRLKYNYGASKLRNQGKSIRLLKIIKEIKVEIAAYCVQQSRESNMEIDQEYLMRIIQKQLKKTIRNNSYLRKKINYKQI